MRRAALAVAALLAGPLLGLGAVPAAAAATIELSDVHVDATVRSVDMTVAAKDLPVGAGLDPRSVEVTADGRRLATASVVAARTAEVRAPSVLLVVDTSGSMAGQPMAEAMQALSTFVTQAPVDVRLGLTSFSTTARPLVAPTVDRPSLLSAVTGLQASGETAVYDAILDGVRTLGATGDRRLVVLSDGGDTRSTASLAQVLAGVKASGVVVDAVGFNTGEAVQSVLARIAQHGGGRVHQASSAAQLASALASTVRPQPRALTVRALVPEDLRGPQVMTVAVTTQQARLTARVPVVLGAAPTVTAPARSWWQSRTGLLVGLTAIGAGLLLGSLALLGTGARSQRRTQDVLDRYTTRPTAAGSDRDQPGQVAKSAVEFADRLVTKRGQQEKLTLRLARAAVALTPAEWVLLQIATAFVAACAFVLLGWHLVLAVLVGVATGALVPNAYLRFRAARRRKAFEDKLPDALQMTAGSLSAGYSLAQALDGLVREGSEPMATEIGKALAESRLGVPVEDTLDGVAERMDSRDFGWVVMAIRVQREVGGNLGGVLTTVSATMRERAMLRRHVRGLSAEGRLSAYILIALPVLLAVYMLLVRREYIAPLYTTTLGLMLIAFGVVMLSVGSFVMSRMVKVEV